MNSASVRDGGQAAAGVESGYAWFRLSISLLLSSIGASGIYVVVVVLPAVQAEFGAGRSDASLPYTLTIVGFGLGGLVIGRLTDRVGVMLPAMAATVFLGIGFFAAGAAGSLWQFALAQGLLMGCLGAGATFGPLIADTSKWFTRRRGIAVAICASGNYVGGAFWPPFAQYFVESIGWRGTYFVIGACCMAALPLALALRRRPPADAAAPNGSAAPGPIGGIGDLGPQPLGMSRATLQTLIGVAAFACCVAMAMPQVHIVAYCSDLGYGATRGAQMLSVMLGLGVVSRLLFGLICDRIGGLRTLAVGSALQAVALVLFLPSDAMASLFIASALFGLFQGGIVPSYAILIREYFPQSQAGARVGAMLMASLLGMGVGGWMSGAIFDFTGSYEAAFLNGIAWNVLNLAIAIYLLNRAFGLGGMLRISAPSART